MPTRSKLDTARQNGAHQVDEQRSSILDAAEALFLQNGLDSTRMIDIAAQAGITKVTLYRYFPNRDVIALEIHAREELGFAPDELGNPVEAAGTSLAAFAVGAALPLLPWFFTGGASAVIASIVLGVIGAASVGVMLAWATGRPMVLAVVRQVGIAAVAAALTFGIGSLVGADVG